MIVESYYAVPTSRVISTAKTGLDLFSLLGNCIYKVKKATEFEWQGIKHWEIIFAVFRPLANPGN